MTNGIAGRAISAVLALVGAAGGAEAAYTVTISQQGRDVVASGSGTINTRAFRDVFATDPGNPPFLQAETATLLTGAPRPFSARFVDLSGPAGGWGPDLSIVEGSGSGDLVYFNAGGVIGVADGYVSGSLLSSRAVFANQSIAGLTLRVGQYSYLYGSGANTDLFTVVIEAPAAVADVPEPATWATMAGGLGAVGGLLRRRRRRPVSAAA